MAENHLCDYVDVDKADSKFKSLNIYSDFAVLSFCKIHAKLNRDPTCL